MSCFERCSCSRSRGNASPGEARLGGCDTLGRDTGGDIVPIRRLRAVLERLITRNQFHYPAAIDFKATHHESLQEIVRRLTQAAHLFNSMFWLLPNSEGERGKAPSRACVSHVEFGRLTIIRLQQPASTRLPGCASAHRGHTPFADERVSRS
jgi:hypothetical protein